MIDTRVAFSNLGCISWWLTPGLLFPTWGVSLADWWLTPGLLFQTWGVSLDDWWLTPGLLFQTWGVSLADWWLTPGLLFQTWGVSLADWCLTPGLLFQTWGVTLVPTLSSAVLFSCKSVGLKLMVIVDVCLTTTYLLFHPEVAVYCMFKVSVHSQFILFTLTLADVCLNCCNS